MELEQKFVVIKTDDIRNALSLSEQEMLQNLCRIVEDYRIVYGKKRNQYVVINHDEPYFPEVLRLIEQSLVE
jgi:hypothetical protein